jgi:hypothetical protein
MVFPDEPDTAKSDKTAGYCLGENLVPCPIIEPEEIGSYGNEGGQRQSKLSFSWKRSVLVKHAVLGSRKATVYILCTNYSTVYYIQELCWFIYRNMS